MGAVGGENPRFQGQMDGVQGQREGLGLFQVARIVAKLAL